MVTSNLVLAFGLLATGMYIAIRVIDFLFSRFTLFHHKADRENANSNNLPSDFDLGIHLPQDTGCHLESICHQLVDVTSIGCDGF